MKAPREIFLTTGTPLPKWVGKRYEGLHRDYRAFNEHDIAKIQKEAFQAGEESFRLAYQQELEARKSENGRL